MNVANQNRVEPLELKKTGEGELTVYWKDGHQSLFSFRYLRGSCPCAGCIDEWTGKRLLDPDSIPKDLKILGANPVGRYGIQFQWSDGHSTGIYSFEHLRSICPCEACRGQVSKAKKETPS
jgi:DUF971 family protein